MGDADLTPIKRLGDYAGCEMAESSERVIELAHDAEVIICNKTPLNRKTLESLPKLKLICIASTGMNAVDLEAVADLGIEIHNSAGYSTRSVAESTIGSALAILQHSTYYDKFVKSGDYSKSNCIFNFDRPTGSLYGKRWGIIGLGTIGREVARLATAFGCDVYYHSTSGVVRNEEWPSVATLDELLSQSDIISIHTPLTAQTEGLMGVEQFAKMQKHAILINVARGGIIDDIALCNALNNDMIAAAALDVFSVEPLPADSPLLKINNMDKLLLSPHNAWAADTSRKQLVHCVEQNILNYINKQK